MFSNTAAVIGVSLDGIDGYILVIIQYICNKTIKRPPIDFYKCSLKDGDILVCKENPSITVTIHANMLRKSLKHIHWKLFPALLVMGLCPAIRTTGRTFLLGQLPGEYSYSIAGNFRG